MKYRILVCSGGCVFDSSTRCCRITLTARLNDPSSKHSCAKSCKSFVGVLIRSLVVGIMSADVVSKSIVDEKTQDEARSLVVAGLLEFLDVTRSGLLRWFKGFEDLEVAVNKKSLISDNCNGLREYEVAHLVRMTEVFGGEEKRKTQTPRSLTFGIVMMKTTETFNVRLWEALTPSWSGGDVDDREMNTVEDITKITDELMLSMCKVLCRDERANQRLIENDPAHA